MMNGPWYLVIQRSLAWDCSPSFLTLCLWCSIIAYTNINMKCLHMTNNVQRESNYLRWLIHFRRYDIPDMAKEWFFKWSMNVNLPWTTLQGVFETWRSFFMICAVVPYSMTRLCRWILQENDFNFAILQALRKISAKHSGLCESQTIVILETMDESYLARRPIL